MKFLNISDIKLKVILTEEDCEKYGIDRECSDYSTRQVRQAVREILERAEHECGFCAAGDKILVQLYPLPEGECELFVTRLLSVSRKNRAELSSADGISLMEHKRGTYRFSSEEILKSAVRAALRDGVTCDLYRDDLGRYYISVNEEFTDGISELEIFVEYGERLPAFPIAVISEYGECLAKDISLESILSENFGGEENF